MTLSPTELEAWHRDGYLVLDQFTSADDLRDLRGAYDDIVDGLVSAEGDRQLGDLTRQIMRPSRSHPVFADNAVLSRAVDVGRQLLADPTAERRFDMLIYKPPGHRHATPWHQDAAYDGMPSAPAGSTMALDSVQFWIPLDDVDAETGCMQFVGGRHRQPLLEHVVASGAPDDAGRLLAIADPEGQLDLRTALVAEIPAGGATVHSYGTPHYTGPNRSVDRQRRAYIVNVGVPTTD